MKSELYPVLEAPKADPLGFFGHVGVYLAMAAAAALCGCGRQDSAWQKDSAVEWTTGPGPMRGHEDITRFAIDMANDMIAPLTGESAYFPKVAKGVSGDDTDHPIVRGNYRTDYPDAGMLDYYQLPEGADWQHDPKLQNIHSLRNYPDGQLQSARDACLGVRKLISDATAHALSLYQQRDHDQGFYFIGHATHTIQDSFSKAHGRRTGDDHRSLSEVCTFGREFAGICYHGIGQLPYDRVWFNTLSCALDPGVRNFDCLTDEAKSASRATAGYLYAVFLLLSGRESLVDDVLARTFDHDASNSYSGYLGCDGLH